MYKLSNKQRAKINAMRYLYKKRPDLYEFRYKDISKLTENGYLVFKKTSVLKEKKGFFECVYNWGI